MNIQFVPKNPQPELCDDVVLDGKVIAEVEQITQKHFDYVTGKDVETTDWRAGAWLADRAVYIFDRGETREKALAAVFDKAQKLGARMIEEAIQLAKEIS